MDEKAPMRRRDRFFKKLGVGHSRTSETAAVPTSAPAAGNVSANVDVPPPLPATTSLPIVSQPYDQFIAEALEKLNEADRAVVEEYFVTSNISETVQQAYDGANKLKSKIEDSRGVIGRRVSNIVQWIDRFKSVGDAIAGLDPIHAGLPWAGVKILLSVAIADIDQMATLVTGMDLALGIANRLRAYFHFFQKLPTDLTTENFHKALVVLYAKVLGFLAQAFKVYKTPVALRGLRTFWQDSTIQDFEAESDKLGARLAIEVSNCDRHLAASDRTETAKWRDELEVQLKALDAIADIKSSLETLQVKFDLSKLEVVYGAAFDSSEQYHLPYCLEGTRVEVITMILNWTREPEGKSIFWLCGKAGTGKSTISRTVAQELKNGERIGASFIFKRGHAGRGNPDLFFATIVAQLCNHIPALRKPVADALDKNSLLCRSNLQTQFDELFRKPIESLDLVQLPDRRVTIVVDALDECERTHVRKLLDLLAEVNAIKGLELRIFITSRPETPIEAGFRKVDGKLHDDIVLEEVQSSSIEDDIRKYFIHEFAEIRAEYDDEVFPTEWPTSKAIEDLVTRAVPLFIFAATVCRFVREKTPRKRLEGILNEKHVLSSVRLDAEYTHLRIIYTQVLQQLARDVDDTDTDDDDENIQTFKRVIGPIILAADPLSAESLSKILQIDIDDINYIVGQLKAVLNVPRNTSQPIQTLHLSFREFLLDAENKANRRFRIDEMETNRKLGEKCLELLTVKDAIRQDICNVRKPGFKRIDLSEEQVTKSIPPYVAYACMYWPHHLTASEDRIADDGLAHKFLTKHLMHWLEAMSWIGQCVLAISSISDLVKLSKGDGCKSLASLLGDAYQFISKFKSVIEVAPLQVYYVGARFTPERSSALRASFADLDSTWDVKPDIPMHWDLYSLSIEGHTQAIRDIVFSPDGQMLASISHDKSLRLWSLTGDQLSLGLHRDYISALGFCENGKQVVSVTMTGHVQFWEVATGRRLWDFHLSGLTPGSRVRSVAISPHGSIAWRHDSAMIWKCDRMGRDVQLVSHLEAKANTEEANSSDVEVETEIGFTVICTSPDGRLVAGTSDGQLFMWNPGWSGQPCQWKGHSSWVLHIAFSTEGHLATYATGDKICIWTWSGGEMSCIWQKSVAHIHGMAFAPNAQLVFAENRTTQQWDPRADQQIGKPIDHASSVIAIAVSTTDQLASATSDNIIRLWPNSSRNGAGDEQDLQYSEVTVCIFSDDGNFLVSGHENGEVRTWDSLTGKELRLLTSADQSLAGDIRSLAVSPDGSSIVSGSRNKILRWWVTSKEKEFHRRHEFFERAVAMTFSTDGAVLALGLGGGFIYLQNGAHDETPRLFASGTDPIESLLFAGDGMSLVSGHFGSAVCLWCVKTGTLLHRFQPNGQQMTTVAISCNGVIACVTEQGWPVQLWDASSKELLLELSAGASVASPRQLEFSADGSILRTNVGDFDLIHAPSTAMSCSALRPAPLRLNADGNWIQRFGEDELWLPPGWRLGHGWFFTFAVRYGATLAIPTATRGMIFWREKSSLSVTESQV